MSWAARENTSHLIRFRRSVRFQFTFENTIALEPYQNILKDLVPRPPRYCLYSKKDFNPASYVLVFFRENLFGYAVPEIGEEAKLIEYARRVAFCLS